MDVKVHTNCWFPAFSDFSLYGRWEEQTIRGKPANISLT